MKNLIRKAAAAGLAAVLTLSLLPVKALGASSVHARETEYISTALTYTKTGFTLSGNKQVSYALSLKPGEDIETVISYGSTIYGGQTLTNTVKSFEAQGRKVIGAVNADFFSVATGIPLGILITDGVLRSYGGASNLVGFTQEGTAFIDRAELTIALENLTAAGRPEAQQSLFDIYAYNRVRQGYGIYLFSRDFYETTRTTTDGTSVILRVTEGDMRLGGVCQAVVESMVVGKDPVAIPEGCLVLSADAGYPYYEQIALFQVGDQVRLTVETDCEALLTAREASGGGDILIQNGSMTNPSDWDGEISQKRTGRTAVGLKADGTVVYYCSDGPRNGYSAGMTLKELAQELLDLGCVAAINMDGGGSTALGKADMAAGTLSVVNNPSDGKERVCSTYFLLTAKNPSDGVAAHLHFAESDIYVLAGASVTLEGVTATDAAYVPVNLPQGINYFLSGDIGTLSSGLSFTASGSPGTGTITAIAANGSRGLCQVSVIKSPQSISVSANGQNNISTLSLKANSSLTLTAQASYMGKTVKTAPNSFSYFASGDIGSITSSGVFTASSAGRAQGTITVACGSAKKEIVVTLRPDFEDVPEGSWFYNAVDFAVEKGLFNGTSDTTFSPNASMTRGMFVTVLGRMSGVNPADYLEVRPGCFVNVREAYMRSGPGTGYEIVTSLFKGDEVTIEGKEDNWYAISCGDYRGYMREDLLKIVVDFTDVDDNAYYAGYINWAVDQGIVSGYGDGTFGPDDSLTREQLAKILYGYTSLRGGSVTLGEDSSLDGFPDAASVSAWAVTPMTWASYKKLINGMDDGTLQPQGTATRAQVATILMNYLK